VAITAVNPESAYVMFMAERDGLLARYILYGFVVRSDDQIGCGRYGHHSHHSAEQDDSEKGVRIA
jgi:hypothetical protein